MKKNYIQPSMTLLHMAATQMLAASNEVNITIDNTEFEGEGRVKSDFSNSVDWGDIWD